jgi:hypothetical protein
MDYKMKFEVKQLVKIGIPEDIALMSVCKKYNKEHLVEDIVLDLRQEQELLQEELAKFTEFKLAEKTE